MQKIIKTYLKSLEKIIDAKSIYEMSKEDIFDMNSFHASEVYMLTEEDDRFLNIRASHFVVESGYSENHAGKCFLISANHKGIRLFSLLLDSSQDSSH
ncbi:hypothetical protein [Alkalibacterium sp. 20]|uniref:hypothetical protein n=1 Tax=Alkalibacterium sp. 20 TaxID=1798803 RepID=UPI0008FFF1BE|nr:hypothetical protein [Alkalibacterium sp. 20]OJF91407.1 hypothetical protein AX762_11065 [Alkalibacterium sp. 20]